MNSKDRLKSLKQLQKDQNKKKRKTKSLLDLMEMDLQYLTLMHDLIGEIDRIPDAMQANLLYLHYIRFIPIKEICEMFYKDYAYTSRLHRKALKEYELLNYPQPAQNRAK